WTRGAFRARLTAPRPHEVTAASWAWAPGTGGATVTGPVVRIDGSTPDSFVVHRRRVKGAWVMTRVPSLVWNNDGPPMTGADAAPGREHREHPDARLGHPVEHGRRDPRRRTSGRGGDRRRAPRLVGSGHGGDRQRHRRDVHARGGPRDRAGGPQAEAHDPLRA